MQRRVTDYVFASVIKRYLASDKFRSLAKSTQDSYRRALTLAEHPDILGGVPVEHIRPALVQGMLDGMSDRPGSQKVTQGALRALESWAIVRDLLPRPITTGTEIVGSKGGHVPWTDAQVDYAQAHCREPYAKAIALGANTGQRGSDLVRMRWTDLETFEGMPGINVRQLKTGVELWIPFTQALLAAMAGWERRPGYILTKHDGSPLTRPQLSDGWTDEARKHADLRSCTLHGLRGTAVVRLRRAGVSVPLISDMVGMSQQMVAHYARKSEQKTNAVAAVLQLDRTALERAGKIVKRPA